MHLKGRSWSRVEVKCVAGRGWRGRVWSDGDSRFRLAKRGVVEEFGGALKAVRLREGQSHGV